MKECKVDSRDLVYENADKLALFDVGKSSELVQCIEDLPETMPANDPRVDLIVKSLFKIDAHPIEKPVSLRDLNESIKDNIASETKISSGLTRERFRDLIFRCQLNYLWLRR